MLMSEEKEVEDYYEMVEFLGLGAQLAYHLFL
jgi:hypothetical protein